MFLNTASLFTTTLPGPISVIRQYHITVDGNTVKKAHLKAFLRLGASKPIYCTALSAQIL